MYPVFHMLTPPLGAPIHWSFVVGIGDPKYFEEAVHFEGLELDAAFALSSCRPTLAAVKEDEAH